MTNPDKINFIREKCIAANPDVANGYTLTRDDEFQDGRPVRLSDVLLATRNKYSSDKDTLSRILTDACDAWNLRADDLREQSEETVEFLYELLK